MPSSFQQLPDPVLVLDSRLAPARAGVLQGGQWLSLLEIAGDPLDGLFLAVQTALSEAGLALRDVGALVYNEGPGSALALRTTAITLSSWQQLRGGPGAPLYSYNTMRLMASQEKGKGSVAVIAAARQGLWHLCQRPEEAELPGSPTLVPTSALKDIKASRLLVLPMSKHWENPPEGWELTAPDLPLLRSLNVHPGLLEARTEPFLHEPPVSDYTAWSGTRHR